jgi:hypothetical protein
MTPDVTSALLADLDLDFAVRFPRATADEIDAAFKTLHARMSAQHRVAKEAYFAANPTHNAFTYMFSPEGRDSTREFRKVRDRRVRAINHANRHRCAADRHDWRVPMAVRIAVLERACDCCERCGQFAYWRINRFELHHITYDRAYGNELASDLLLLCPACHRQEHGQVHEASLLRAEVARRAEFEGRVPGGRWALMHGS